MRTMLEGTTYVVAGDTLSECWMQAVYDIYTRGTLVTTEYGTVEKPLYARCLMPMVMDISNLVKRWHPEDPFCTEHRIEPYRKQLSRAYLKMSESYEPIQKFEYTYIDRLVNYTCPGPCRGRVTVIDTSPDETSLTSRSVPVHEATFVDQLRYINEELKKPRYDTKRLQAITWMPRIDADPANEHPPCLQRIWVYPHRNNRLDVHIHYRSWDMLNAFEANLIAFHGLIHDELLNDTPFVLGHVKCIGDNAHIYETDMQEAGRALVRAGRM